MLIRFFPHHGRRSLGCGKRAVGYLTKEIDPVSKEPRLEVPAVVKGEPERVAELIDSLEFKHVYKSGVLSWAPGESVSLEQEREAVKRFERVAFAGLEPQQYEILWVRHTHAGHHELHFITPRVELSTGKSLNIDPPGSANREVFDLVRKQYNIEFGFSDPEDPARKRELNLPDHIHLKKSQDLKRGIDREKDMREAVHEYVTRMAEDGLIRDRADLVAALKDVGLEIPRAGENYITVLDRERGQRVRLKGEMYHEQWELGREAKRERGGPERISSEDRERKLGELEREIERITAKRALYNRERYRGRSREVEREHEKALQLEPKEPSLNRGLDSAQPGSRDLELELVSVHDAQRAAKPIGNNKFETEPPGRGAQERAFLRRPGAREGPCTGDTGVRVHGWKDGQSLGVFIHTVTEEYDRVREAAFGYCREIGERLKRARREINLLLERGREALEQIGRAVRRGPEVLKELSLKRQRQKEPSLGHSRDFDIGF